MVTRASPPSLASEKPPRSLWRQGLLGTTLAAMAASMILIFFWVPTDANLGVVQRVFYIHMPVAVLGMAAFGVMFVASVLYLWRRHPRWDALAYAAAEPGVVLATLMLVTGMIFARPVWGVWWQWDPRLTTALILWFLYVAYFMLRAYAPTPAQGARYAAVLSIIGFVDVPIIYFSVQWWRTVHPPALLGPLAESGGLDPSMRLTLLVSLLAFTLLFAYLVLERYSLRRVELAFEEARQHYAEL